MTYQKKIEIIYPGKYSKYPNIWPFAIIYPKAKYYDLTKSSMSRLNKLVLSLKYKTEAYIHEDGSGEISIIKE